jgi:hypothetical protein
MTKSKLFIHITLVAILFSGSCTKEAISLREEQPVYFEYEYVNYAWEYQHSGWLIDPSGKIHGYNLPDVWNFPDSAGFISETNIEMNLSQTDTIYDYQIITSELNKRIHLIPEAAVGRLSELKNAMADAGGWSYYCYIWDSCNKKYKRILLDLKGDFEQFNKSSAARNLVSWLKEVRKNL